MADKIFRSILLASVAVLAAALVMITGVLYPYFSGLQETQLRDELHLAAGAVQRLGRDYLEGLQPDKYRLTWVGADGAVLFDSHADVAAMENHGDREEIREAMVSGIGGSSRRSSTLTEQTLYEAQRLEDGSVLRISVSRATALMLVLGMLQPILILLALALGLSAFLAHRMAKRVVGPLNQLDLDHPLANDTYEELSPLLHRLQAQRKEIEEQVGVLRQKQEEFDQITAHMQEALILLDHAGRILSINPAARALFDIGGHGIGEDFLFLDRRQDMRAALEEANARGHADFRTVIGERGYQFDLSRIESEGGRQGMVILAFDMTEQMDAERHRREFTANVSHELKTPLQSIIGSAELMENGIVKEADVPRFVGHIRREASRLVTLIDDIIRLSQLDEGAEMPRETVAMKPLSEEICESLADAAGEKDISVSVTGDEGAVIGVRRLLYEVVYNLCDNAIKYNRPGGWVRVSVAEEQGMVRFRVSDNGIGIAPEHQQKIFERFYRVDKSHSRQSGGTGLGLSIVKHAVQYHQGKIAVESKTDQGTTMTVLLHAKS